MKKLILVLLLIACVAPAHAQKFQADSNINVTSTIITGTSGTALVISSKGATVYGVDASNESLAPVFIKLYNATTGTCGTGTPFARFMIPGTSLSGTSASYPIFNGDAYVNGIVMCIVKGIADSDSTQPSSGTGVANIHWKQSPP